MSTPDCRTCGACCAYSASWPEFDPLDAADGSTVPVELVRPDGGGMACDGDRCRALAGVVGDAVHCTVYAQRPALCREFEAGSDTCLLVRDFFGLGDGDAVANIVLPLFPPRPKPAPIKKQGD